MEKFLFAFHGGKLPDDPDQAAQITANWQAWMQSLGSALADPGSIIGGNVTVEGDAVADNGGANPLSGYMIVRAADKAAAIETAKGCPILQGGGSVEVAPLISA